MRNPAIDPEVFKEVSELMDDSLADFIRSYLDNSPKLLSDINQALTDGDMEVLFTQAHLLRGGSGSIGAMKVFELANEIEEKARAGVSNGLAPLVVKLRLAYQQVDQELKALL